MERRGIGRIGTGLAGVLLATGACLAEARIGYLTLEDAYVERQQVASGFGGAEETTLRDVIATLDSIAGRDDLEGLVLRLREPTLNRTQMEEIGRAITRVRDAGKRVHVFTENYGTGEVLLGCFADEMILQAGGSLSIPGVYMEEMYLADTLRWIGIEPDYVQIGDYKGAQEMMANAAPSPEWDQNISGLLDAMYADMLSVIERGRGLSRQQAEDALAQCFWASGQIAIDAGLLDTEIDRMDLEAHLSDQYAERVTLVDDLWVTSGPAKPDFASMGMFEAFGALMRMMSETGVREPQRDTIALLYIDGVIVDGESGGGGLLAGGTSVGSLTVRKALREIETNDLVKGLVVRIDSPGGSATASEMIWQGLQRVSAAGKPVWVSVGSMAASGGYYIAVGADRIFVNQSSIVGSIGVVGGHLAMGGLYEKLRMNVVPRARGPRADILGSTDVWSPENKAMIRKRMTETYDLFASRVVAGRPGIDMARAAEGRLFLGADAIELGMADAVSGIDAVLQSMADETRLEPGAYDVLEYPAPVTFGELIEQMLGISAHAPGRVESSAIATAARAALGEDVWAQASWSIRALLEFRDRPVMLVLPRVLVWRW